MTKLEIAVKALKKIKKDQGRVCAEFEICTHDSCISSHAAWEIADRALKEISDLTNNEFIGTFIIKTLI